MCCTHTVIIHFVFDILTHEKCAREKQSVDENCAHKSSSSEKEKKINTKNQMNDETKADVAMKQQ